MVGVEPSPEARLRRLAEELGELGVQLPPGAPGAVLLGEIDYALRPVTHERRVPSYGAVVDPTRPDATWGDATELRVSHRDLGALAESDARRFADGLSTFVVRHTGAGRGPGRELVVFDRPAGSERDLVVLAAATGGTLVQRHPSGLVRIVDRTGVLRGDGLRWHREPPVDAWIDAVGACSGTGRRDVLTALLEFAVHDLGARNVGALLIYRPEAATGRNVEMRLAEPPPLDVLRPADLAPLRHVLAQIDGAAVVDRNGILRQLGVRLVPSEAAEADVDGFGGMRHTSALRYSVDDPEATMIVVSEDGPVTVLRHGRIMGRSEAP